MEDRTTPNQIADLKEAPPPALPAGEDQPISEAEELTPEQKRALIFINDDLFHKPMWCGGKFKILPSLVLMKELLLGTESINLPPFFKHFIVDRKKLLTCAMCSKT